MNIEEIIKSSNFKLTAIFAGGNAFSLFASFVAGILTAKVIDPATLGLFNGLGLVLGYIPFLQLGVLNGLNRELPYLIGTGDKNKAHELAASSQALALVVGGFVATVLMALSLWYALHNKWNYSAGWATYAFSGFMVVFGQQYLQVVYRTKSDFAKLSLINVIQSIVSLILILLVVRFKYYGLCLRSLLISLSFLTLLWSWRPVKVKSKWDINNLKILFKVGAPIFIVGQLYSWWAVLNNTLVLKYMGTKGLGLFQLSTMVIIAVGVLSGSVCQIAYPKMALLYGQNKDKKVILRTAERHALALAAAYVPVIILGLWLIGPVTRYFLPKYVEGIQAAQITLIVAALSAFTPMNLFFNVVKKQGFYLAAIICGMIIYIVMLLYLNKQGHALTNYPLAMAAGQVIFIIISLAFIYYLTSKEEDPC